jgi:ADP-heptose:LPS heptosyltransferase
LQDKDRNFQHILVIDFGQLGDVVMSLPALQAIRHKFPASHIAVLTGKATGEVVAISGLADEVIKLDRIELRDGPKLESIAKIFRFVGEIRRRQIDLVIDLHSLSETNILAYLSTAKYRLLANRESRSLDWLSNFRPRPPKEDKAKHLSEKYLDVLKPLGIDNIKPEFRFRSDTADVDFVGEKFFAGQSKTVIGLFPGAGHPSRCWELNNFAELAEKLEADGLRTAVFLGPEEAKKRDEIVGAFPYAIVIDGLSIAQFIAAASQVDAFVTNDTGPMHLAACAGAPILLLPDNWPPSTYLPLTERLELVQGKTIKEISADEAFAAVKRLINS